MTADAWWRRWWPRAASQVAAGALDVEAPWTPWPPSLTSPDGFERQAAVEACEWRGDTAALPQLLLRVNDWVPQVRQAAQRAVWALLRDEVLPVWLQSLDALVALERARRADHAALLMDVADFLARPAHRDAVRAAADASTAHGRRYVFALLLSRDAPGPLLADVLRGGDVQLARTALAAVARLPMAERPAWLALACRSPIAVVRAQALRAVLAQWPADALADAMVFDRSAAVRGIALFGLKADGRSPRALATALAQAEQARQAAQRLAVLHVVASLDPAAARPLVQAGLADSSVPLRRLAFTLALDGAEPQEREGLLLRALSDVSPKIRQVAVEAVRRGALAPDDAVVLQLMRDQRSAGVWRHAFVLVRHAGPWRHLQYLFALLQEADEPALVEACHAELARWSPCYTGPDASQRAALEEAWRHCAGRVSEPLRGRLAATLQTC